MQPSACLSHPQDHYLRIFWTTFKCIRSLLATLYGVKEQGYIKTSKNPWMLKKCCRISKPQVITEGNITFMQT